MTLRWCGRRGPARSWPMPLISQLECASEWNALHVGVNQSFAIAHSHYRHCIDLETMRHGFVPGYEVHELEEMEAAVAPLL